MEYKILEIILQFVLLVVAGGYVTKLYTKSQRDKEVRQNTIQEFSAIFSQFVALRFKANVHLLKNGDAQRYSLVKKAQISAEILNCYYESCELLGRYQALKPLIQLNFKVHDADLDQLHQYYQSWRRCLREISPVYQSDNPDDDTDYQRLRAIYHKIVGHLKDQS